jgi:Restriction endonuclease
MDITSPLIRPSLVYEWQGFLPAEGRSWRFREERLDEFAKEGAIFFPPTGRPRLKRYLSDTGLREEKIDERPAVSQLEFIVRQAMRAIAVEIAHNPSCLKNVEWRDLERLLREVFEGLGFDTQLTRSSKDGGFDLMLKCIERGVAKIFLVEVKHWVSK